tara:strand:+ start:225 stop:707 length:483 start_codon:yes stop_codon:yes gene_type:complete
MKKIKSKSKTRNIKIYKLKLGKNVTIYNPSNLYNCFIDDNSFIGPFVEIQGDVKIGKNCRIQSHSFICEKTRIDDDCFISHGVVFVNDLFKNGKRSYGDKKKWKGAKIGKKVLIGSNATILPIKICSGAVIGAGAVVTKNIKTKGIYAGNPAKLLKRIDG